MRTTRIAAAAAATAAAAALVTAGIANAGPTPTGDYQMCGYVYSNSSETSVHDQHNSALPGDPSAASGDTMLAGYQVTGKINGTSTTYTGTSDANGAYCMQGDAAMATIIGLGGSVSITGVKDGAGNTKTFAVQHSSIGTSTFLAHQTSTWSASGFHVKVS
ncbi:hypothetical protein [Prescottella equi]|uniref:Secreted protein n=1 Tax=Rhodococcus hoagii (strain 103S) TaxID=685727 RepID=A0A3S5YB98_RHOH1|nr:hypothetical protein [Prescottella equi]CBH49841.1 putative secreted protein [Prescottella equi 103S]